MFMGNVTKGTVRVGGVTLTYRQGGRGDDILLVHGLGSWSAVWRPLMGELSSDFRVTALDLPGHGGSGPVPRRYSIGVLVGLIASFAKRAGLSVAVAVGHSFGCLPLVRGVAALGCRTLVLFSPVLGGTENPSWIKPLFSGERGKLFRVRANRRGMLKVFLDMLYDAESLDAPFMEELLRPLEKEENRNGLVKTAELIETAGHALIRDLRALNRPALLIRGREDPLSEDAVADAVFDTPGIRQVVINHCGHFPQIEKPGEAADHIKIFAEESR